MQDLLEQAILISSTMPLHVHLVFLQLISLFEQLILEILQRVETTALQLQISEVQKYLIQEQSAVLFLLQTYTKRDSLMGVKDLLVATQLQIIQL